MIGLGLAARIREALVKDSEKPVIPEQAFRLALPPHLGIPGIGVILTPKGISRVSLLPTAPVTGFPPEEALPEPVRAVYRQVVEYLEGIRKTFQGIPLNLSGTPFQRRVWRALQEIPYGETRSYEEVARAVGAPQAVRAVGQACARNPVALLIPCHRVVRKEGSLGGYSGGLRFKCHLLSLEQQREIPRGNTGPVHPPG